MHMKDQAVGTSRRTVVRGAAWSVPVVAAVAVAPVASASGYCTGTTCFGSISIHKCCDAGTKYYWANLSFTNNGNSAVNVTFNFTLVTSANGTLMFAGGGPVPANSTVSFYVESALNGNCSQGTYGPFTLNFSDGVNPPGAVPIPGGATGGSVCPPGAAGKQAAATEEEVEPEPSASATEPEPEPSASATAPEPEPSASATEPEPEPSASS